MASDVAGESKAQIALRNEELRQRAARYVRKKLDEEEKAKDTGPELVFTKVSSIAKSKPERIFGGRLERGSFSFIVGQGEVGKGVISADIIAKLTTGDPFPGDGGKRRQPLKVLVCVVEDSEEQIRGRLEAAGANLDMVVLLSGPMVNRGGLTMPSAMRLDSDAGRIVAQAKAEGFGALFVETVVEHLGDREGEKKISTNTDADVRSSLAPFRAICKEANLFGWALIHPRKGNGDPIEGISGSQAFFNVPRLIMQIFKDPSDENKNPRRLLVTLKSNNLPRRPPTYRFRIEASDHDADYPKVVWGIEGKSLEDPRGIEEVQAEKEEKQKARRDIAVFNAEEFLKEIIQEGVMIPPDEIYKQGEERGLSEKSIDRAKKKLRLVSVKEGFPAEVVGWQFPKEEI